MCRPEPWQHTQDLHDATMPQVELPRELPREVQEKERESAERAEEEGDARSVATAGSVAALEEHEKGYGAKLPPEVVGEFEEEARPTERGGDAGQQLPADRWVQGPVAGGGVALGWRLWGAAFALWGVCLLGVL